MVCHNDLTMYLVAVKSFYRRVGEGEIVILNDGSLTPEDCGVLSEHLGSPTFLQLSNVDTGGFPKGGCWERILSILDLLGEFYVVQLDSDTLTQKDVPEVVACIHSNTSFTLGTRQGKEIIGLQEAAERARTFRGAHVQDESERNFAKLPDAAHKRYVRGSAGFAGFAKGAQSRGTAADFSQRMTELIGKKWNEWGSEQVASSYLVANSPQAAVLPHPKYMCFDPARSFEEPAFLHFLGSNRYDKGVYTRRSRSVIRSDLR
jgi:hypothetical protein